MGQVRWKLRELMLEHGLSIKQVNDAAGFGGKTLYRTLNATQFDTRKLASLLDGLYSLTSKRFTMNDLFEYDY